MTAEVLKQSRVGNKSISARKVRRRRTVVATRLRKEHGFGLALRCPSTEMDLQAKLQEVLVHIIHADDHVLVRLEEDGAIVSEERRKELERSRLSLSIGALPVKMVIGRRGTENRFRHRPLHGLHCRRHDVDK